MALGFLECAGYGAVLYAMDQACKAADIRIMGIDTISPLFFIVYSVPHFARDFKCLVHMPKRQSRDAVLPVYRVGENQNVS